MRKLILAGLAGVAMCLAASASVAAHIEAEVVEVQAFDVLAMEIDVLDVSVALDGVADVEGYGGVAVAPTLSVLEIVQSPEGLSLSPFNTQLASLTHHVPDYALSGGDGRDLA